MKPAEWMAIRREDTADKLPDAMSHWEKYIHESSGRKPAVYAFSERINIAEGKAVIRGPFMDFKTNTV